MTEGLEAKEWPTKCDAPDLSSLEQKLTINLMLNRAFVGGGPSNGRSFALVVNYVRVVDALVIDYNQFRGSLHEYVTTPNTHISPLFNAISDAEECVSNLLRAIRMARRIRKDKLGPHVEKTITVLRDAIVKRVEDFRNEIQHLDNVLVGGTWQPPDPHCLVTRNDRLELYGKEILYSDLATWITSLHALSVNLAQYKEKPTS